MTSNGQIENGNQEEYLAHFKAISSFIDALGLKGKRKEDIELPMQEFLLDILSLERQRLREHEARKQKRKLKKRKKNELIRQYVSLATMFPFAFFMATELLSLYSDNVLLGTINAGLSHALLPFGVLSLICTLYLIYNNRKIAQKEQEIENVESGREDREEKQKFKAPDTTEILNYVEVIAAILVIASEILSEAAPLAGIEDGLLFIANAISFTIAYCNYNNSEKKEVGEDNDKLSKKEGSSLIPGLMLAGSATLLLKRVLLVTTSASSLSPAAGPLISLLGMALLITASISAAHAYREKLTDVKVSGHKNLHNNIAHPDQLSPNF